MSLALGIFAALAAAVLYSVGVTLQSVEARQAPEEESLHASLLKHLAGRPRWRVGTSFVLGGWATQAGALGLVPITIVQPALAVSVVVLLFIAVRFFGETVRGREVAAALAIVVGVGGLVVGSPGESHVHAAPLPLALGMGVLGAVALAPYVLRGHRSFGALIAVSAGLAYAWTGFATSFLVDGVSSGGWVVAALWLGATAAAGLVGLLSEMTALQHGSPISVFPVVLVVQIVVSVLLAPLLGGKGWSPGPLLIAGLAVSLAVLAAGTYALAGSRSVEGAMATEEVEGDAAGAGGSGARA